MNCKKVIIEISSYLDGALDAGVKAELELHLSNCEDCRLVVNTTRKTIQIFCNSEPVPLPAEVRERLHAALVECFRRKKKTI